MRRELTHVEINYGDSTCSFSLNFITRDGEGKYHYRFTDAEVRLEDIQKKIAEGDIAELYVPLPIRQDQKVFRSSERKIYLVDGENPEGNPRRLLIENNPDRFGDWETAFLSRHRSVPHLVR